MFQTKGSRTDLSVSIFVTLLAIFILLLPLFFSESGATLAVSSEAGTERYPLSVDREIEIHSNGHTLTVQIRNGKACVLSGSCPDGVCLASGWIHQSGQTVVCAPAGVRLLIEGGDGNVDFVAG